MPRVRPFRLLPLLLLSGLAAGGAVAPPTAAMQAAPDRGASTPPGGSPRAEALERVVTELETEIRRAMVEGQIPSVTMALTVGEEIVWSGALGETNLRTRTPATPQSVYIIASTLKTMVATVVVQLAEEGHFQLDDPVTPLLGGVVIPGEDPERPLTIRHLLTHTSGLAGGFSSVPVWADTVPRSLDRFLAEGLRIQGPPEEAVRYSNPAFAVLARLIQETTGEDFRDEVRRRIWEPLGMQTTAFAPTPQMEEVLAVPYRPHPESGSLEPLARTRFAEWPAGGAWGTVEDQARWIMAAVNGMSVGDIRLLSPEGAALMRAHQFPDFSGPMGGGWGGEGAGYGLAWWTVTRGGERYIAHSGSVGGYTAFIHGNADRRLGVALLTNGNRAHPHLVRLSWLATDLLAREGFGG